MVAANKVSMTRGCSFFEEHPTPLSSSAVNPPTSSTLAHPTNARIPIQVPKRFQELLQGHGVYCALECGVPTIRCMKDCADLVRAQPRGQYVEVIPLVANEHPPTARCLAVWQAQGSLCCADNLNHDHVCGTYCLRQVNRSGNQQRSFPLESGARW